MLQIYEKIAEKIATHVEEDIKRCEDEMDDDAESIITNERYVYISSISAKSCHTLKFQYIIKYLLIISVACIHVHGRQQHPVRYLIHT